MYSDLELFTLPFFFLLCGIFIFMVKYSPTVTVLIYLYVTHSTRKFNFQANLSTDGTNKVLPNLGLKRRPVLNIH